MDAGELFEQVVDVDLLASFKAMAAESGHWRVATCELVDNSLDQKARNVTVTIDGKKRAFQIHDDGDGCADLSLFVGLGRRKQTSSRPIGMHGWGAKRALLFIANDVTAALLIVSHYRNERRRIATTFESIGRERMIKGSVSENVGNELGTRIDVRGFKRTPPTKETLKGLIADLGFTYSLALEDGRKIIVNDQVVKASEPPPFAREITDEFKLDETRAVRLRFGVVKQGANNTKRPGIHYRYGYRVVEQSSSKGCGDYSVSRVYGYVDLLGSGWKLSALKDEVYEGGSLHAEVFRRIEPLLQEAQEQQMEVRSAALIENAERLLNQSIGKTLKAKRAPRSGEKPGTKEPTGRGKGHQRAERVQSGETFGDRSKSPPRGKIHIDFAELDSDVVGDMPGNTVRLNLNVGAVASARDEENVINVYTMAMFIYHMKTSSDGHFDAKVIDEVLSKVGRALSTDANASVDGRSVLPIAAE